MGSSLRHTKSEENLTGNEQSSDSTNNSNGAAQQQSIRQTPNKSIVNKNGDGAFNYLDDDPADCWSQEDDEITQQVCLLMYYST